MTHKGIVYTLIVAPAQGGGRARNQFKHGALSSRVTQNYLKRGKPGNRARGNIPSNTPPHWERGRCVST